MKLQFSIAAVLAASLALGGHVACSSTTSSSSSSGSSGGSSGGGGNGTDPGSVPGGTPYSGTDVTCSVGDAWAVPQGDPAPDASDSSLVCSVDPVQDPTTGDDVYCCYDWTGSSSTCAPDSSLTADCQAACAQDTTNPCQPGNVFGFSCASGDDPTSLDSSLNCSADPNGTGLFCCE